MKFFLPQIFFGLLTQARNSLAWFPAIFTAPMMMSLLLTFT